jgi:hypothetical protein
MARRRTYRRRGVSPGNILLALLLLLAIYLYQAGTLQRWWTSLSGGAPSQQPALATSAPAGTGSGDVRVFFTTTSLVYPDVRSRRPASPLLQAVIADIDAARKSVNLATFDFDIPEVTRAQASRCVSTTASHSCTTNFWWSTRL